MHDDCLFPLELSQGNTPTVWRLQIHREIKPKIALLTEKRCDVCSNSAQISSQPTAEIPHDDGTGEDDVAGN
jgi:hypothetical protein